MKKTKGNKEKFLLILGIALIAAALVIFKLAELITPIDSSYFAEKSKLNAANDLADQVISENSSNEDRVIECDSIVQGVKDNNIPDGDYVFRVTGMVDGTQETKDYVVELINYYDDVTYSLASGEDEKIVSLGDDTKEYKMLIVKYHKNLTINEGVTVTATNVDDLTYKKGMYLCVLGDINNKGTISMTARGTYNCEGENVYLWKNVDNTYEYVPAEGGTGGETVYAGRNQSFSGEPGIDGDNRSTGGGGSGGSLGSDGSPKSYSGAGSAGTSYSGGTGGGGCNTNTYGTAVYAENGAPNGGKGGNGAGARYSSSWYSRRAGGGAGNTGGLGGENGIGNTTTGKGENGTGGLLTIYSNHLYNDGTIESKGSKGGYYAEIAGGSSGGGSINIFYNYAKNTGVVTAEGGEADSHYGSKGGDGSVTIKQVKANLEYDTDSIYLDLNETYEIDKSKITLMNQNEIQTGMISMGNIEFESLNPSIATVDSNGKITAVGYGETKVKIKDIKNDIYQYINILVVVKMDSLVQGFRDIDLSDGKYKASVNGKLYEVELINYYNDVTYTEDTQLGDSTKEYKTLVVKYHGNLTINEGVKVTAKSVDELTYKKGMYLCVLGDITNNGTISMTAKGTYNCEGEDVYLWKNIDDSYEYVPAEGGAGGEGTRATKNQSLNGNNGEDGENRKLRWRRLRRKLVR